MTDEAEIRHESVGRQGYPRVTLLQSHSGEWWRIETRRGRKLDVPHGERAPTYVTQASRGIFSGVAVAWRFPEARRDSLRIDAARQIHDAWVCMVEPRWNTSSSSVSSGMMSANADSALYSPSEWPAKYAGQMSEPASRRRAVWA